MSLYLEGPFRNKKGGVKLRDEEIIEFCFARKEEALSIISEKYGAYCKKVAENILGNPEDSEECFSSALFAFWNCVPPEKPENLKIFLAKITRNFAINKLRERTTEKRGGKETPEIFDELSEIVPSGENVEENFIAKELGKSINRFAKELPERERKIFIRRYFFMETTEEIGKRYALLPGNVAVILHRIRKKLKKHLEKEGFAP